MTNLKLNNIEFINQESWETMLHFGPPATPVTTRILDRLKYLMAKTRRGTASTGEQMEASKLRTKYIMICKLKMVA